LEDPVEVLVGLIILAIGLLGIAAMQITAVKGNTFSNRLTQASYAAQDRLEFLKTLPITSRRGSSISMRPMWISVPAPE